MKKITFYFALLILVLLSFMSCSTTPDEPLPSTSDVNVNTGPLKLFVLDTARVKTISMTGTNETTILNRFVNTSSYIYQLSLNANGSKFVYSDVQGSSQNGMFTATKTVRIANANGSGDMVVYTVPTSTASTQHELSLIKYGSNKIFFVTTTRTFVGGVMSIISKFNSINPDGTGLVTVNFVGSQIYSGDITSDGKFYGSSNSSGTGGSFTIMDRTGDNGGGSVYYTDTFSSSLNVSNLVFSYDNKFAYYSYLEGQTLKVKIINMATKTAEIKTVATGVTTSGFSSGLDISVASDNNRGIIVVNQYDNNPTKSYVFNLTSGSSATFNNNDRTISTIMAF